MTDVVAAWRPVTDDQGRLRKDLLPWFMVTLTPELATMGLPEGLALPLHQGAGAVHGPAQRHVLRGPGPVGGSQGEHDEAGEAFRLLFQAPPLF